MRITDAQKEDRDALLSLWEKAVRATHGFLSEEDILSYRKLLCDTYLPQAELYLARKGDTILGFMGLAPPESRGRGQGPRPAKVTMLFVAPEYHRRGVGRFLLRYAEEKYGCPLEVDVNEENSGAVRFYEKCGFVQFGRSETDEQGNPFPLLHLRCSSASSFQDK